VKENVGGKNSALIGKGKSRERRRTTGRKAGRYGDGDGGVNLGYSCLLKIGRRYLEGRKEKKGRDAFGTVTARNLEKVHGTRTD